MPAIERVVAAAALQYDALVFSLAPPARHCHVLNAMQRLAALGGRRQARASKGSFQASDALRQSRGSMSDRRACGQLEGRVKTGGGNRCPRRICSETTSVAEAALNLDKRHRRRLEHGRGAVGVRKRPESVAVRLWSQRFEATGDEMRATEAVRNMAMRARHRIRSGTRCT